MRHPIPEAALKKHIAILGMNGSGKTSVAKSEIIEPALDIGERVCNIDPTGVGWGLRLNASGKGKGYSIYIVGGDHADFPLFRRDGRAWGEIVGTSSDSFVFDTSQMTVEDRSQWFTDFAETLIRKNKGPLKLILDEAHLFAPQGGAKSGGVAPKMLHATNNLLALGRSRGLRITMISQRPAKLHKDSLTQAHTLIAMSLMAPHDRRAVEDWIADQADAERGKEIIASLPSLKPGEGWIWAPKEGILERAKFARPITFDSSSAPEDASGEELRLAPINPAAIKARLATVAKETTENDPKALRAEIARLTAAAKTPAIADPDAVERAYQRGAADGLAQASKSAHELMRIAAKDIKDKIGAVLNHVETLASPSNVQLIDGHASKHIPARAPVTKPVPRESRLVEKLQKTFNTIASQGTFTSAQCRVLASLAFWRTVGHDTPAREQVAAVAGYAAGSGNFNNLLGGLKSAGAIDYPTAGIVSLSIEYDGGMDASDAKAMLERVLNAPQQRILDALNAIGGHGTREQIAEGAGYAAGSGNFNNLLGSLRTLRIIDYPRSGEAEITDWAKQLLA